MVKRRSRKYSSDYNSESDCSFSDNETESEGPAKKKYSLRERRGPSSGFITFDNDEDEDDEEKEREPDDDDEDFQVEPEFQHDITTQDLELPDVPTANGTDEPEGGSGLIDFEDIIRADIVINKNKIDYDNLIEKNEIRPQKKKGRKAKTEEIIETKLEEEGKEFPVKSEKTIKEEIKIVEQNE